MGFEHPDLQFKNNTPYGILIWTSYTDTSVTVTLYSTQYAYGQQTGQTDRRSRAAAPRSPPSAPSPTPTAAPPTDTFRARYRDAGVTSC